MKTLASNAAVASSMPFSANADTAPELVGSSGSVEAPDLAADAYDALLDMIQRGRVPTEQPLQERTLAAMLGISRTPLREAMSRLIGGGFAIRTARGQLIVKEPTLRQYLEIFQIRWLIESEAAAEAATRLDVEQARDVMAEVQALMSARKTSAEENHRVDNLVHDTIARASGNHMMAQLVHDLRIKARSFDNNAAPGRVEHSCREHVEILQAIVDRDPDAARAAMRRHLDHVREKLVARHTQL